MSRNDSIDAFELKTTKFVKGSGFSLSRLTMSFGIGDGRILMRGNTLWKDSCDPKQLPQTPQLGDGYRL